MDQRLTGRKKRAEDLKAAIVSDEGAQSAGRRIPKRLVEVWSDGFV